MRVAMIGAGKLGFPVGVAMAARGHDVTFNDRAGVLENYTKGFLPDEAKIESYLGMQGGSVRKRLYYDDNKETAIAGAEIIFVAVQTPHAPEQDGSCRFKNVKSDFDLSHIIQVSAELSKIVQPDQAIVYLSTMLPGSMRRVVEPFFHDHHDLFYSPSFIAMGTVIQDFLKPEMWLIGTKTLASDCVRLADFYDTINPETGFATMTWESAEATKVLYNTWITTKITLANIAMEMSHRVPYMNCDHITTALMKATDRIVSPRYMIGGMVDGGPCHPRDNIALSWFSEKIGMDYNWFEGLMQTREKQVEFLADLVEDHQDCTRSMPVVIMGCEFKTGTKITDGSPSLLLAAILRERGMKVYFDDEFAPDFVTTIGMIAPSVYVIGSRSGRHQKFPFQEDSTIIDPWGIMKEVYGCELLKVGRN